MTPTAVGTPSGPEVLVLQQGLAGYAGGRDTYLAANAADSSFANESLLPLTAGGSTSLLYQFNLDGVPANAQIVRATLSVRAQGRSALVRLFAELYQVTQPWDPNSATWNQAQAGVPWQTPGGQIDTIPLARKVLLADQLWYSLDLTPLVQRWIDGTADNNGVLLRAVSDAPVTFDLTSNEYAVSQLRPRLTVTYLRGGATATPTSTPTRTSTRTLAPASTPTRILTRIPFRCAQTAVTL